jgi:hypothetical protein
MSKAARYNEGKPKLSYFRRSFPWMLEAIARVKEFGAAKYNENNWRLGGKPDTEYLDALDRHLGKFLSGTFYDEETGCPHLAHAVWNLCALAELNYKDYAPCDMQVFLNSIEKIQGKKKEVKFDLDLSGPNPVRDLLTPYIREAALKEKKKEEEEKKRIEETKEVTKTWPVDHVFISELEEIADRAICNTLLKSENEIARRAGASLKDALKERNRNES